MAVSRAKAALPSLGSCSSFSSLRLPSASPCDSKSRFPPHTSGSQSWSFPYSPGASWHSRLAPNLPLASPTTRPQSDRFAGLGQGSPFLPPLRPPPSCSHQKGPPLLSQHPVSPAPAGPPVLRPPPSAFKHTQFPHLFFFLFFCLFRAAPAAYGGSQARA